MEKIQIIDTTLRDGMHVIKQQFTPEQMKNVAQALDQTRIFGIEFGHGAGLGGSGEEYGVAAATDEEYLAAVMPVVSQAKTMCLYIPGLGQPTDLQKGLDAGLAAVRVAVNSGSACEAKEAIEQVRLAGKLPIGFLMMASTLTAKELGLEADKLVQYGAKIVYVTDSAGAMLPDQVRQAVSEIKQSHPDIGVGFHGHNNLGLAITNSLVAIEAGATYIDCTLRGMGAGAGNTQTEVFSLLLQRLGKNNELKWQTMLEAAAELIDPILPTLPSLTNELILIGANGQIGNASYVADQEKYKKELK